MSRRREVQSRLRQLGEIGEIMRSMKNLALMETRKLSGFVEAQQQGIAFLESVAADFLHHYPQVLPTTDQPRVLLLVGSERGFCGEFNERLIQRLKQEKAPFTLLAVGHKLADRLREHGYEPATLEGATVAEELTGVIDRLIAALVDLQSRGHPGLNLEALIHGEREDSPELKSVLPPFCERPADFQPCTEAPMLYLTPERFYQELTEHYLMALLIEIVHKALQTENELRIRHLEGALQRMEEKTAELERRSQRLRQEEITEEIEIILLSVEGLK